MRYSAILTGATLILAACQATVVPPSAHTLSLPLEGPAYRAWPVENLAELDTDMAGFAMTDNVVQTPLGGFDYRLCRLDGPDYRFRNLDDYPSGTDWFFTAKYVLRCSNRDNYRLDRISRKQPQSLALFQSQMALLMRPWMQVPASYDYRRDCQLQALADVGAGANTRNRMRDAGRHPVQEKTVHLYLNVTVSCAYPR